MRLIRADEVELLKDMILNEYIYTGKEFKVINKQLECEIIYDDLSPAMPINQAEVQFALIRNSKMSTLKYKGREGMVLFHLWETSKKGIKPVLNLALTAAFSDGEYIFGEYFYQIDLFEALVDNDRVYITRNIGAYEGTYPKKKIISFEGVKYIEVLKVNIKDLVDSESKEDILRDFIYNFLECALLNQQLIEIENGRR